MQFPTLNTLYTTRDMVDVFGGYNHNLRINSGDFYDMENLTSDNYPVLSPRKQRGVYATPENPQALVSQDALCYVDGSYFVINGYRVDIGLSTLVEDYPKQLVSMGAYVIIFPDKKYVNTADVADYGDIEISFEWMGKFTYSLCRINGEEYKDAVASDTAPDNPANMDVWIDTSSEPHSLKQYASTSDQWVSIATTYIKISCDELHGLTGFKELAKNKLRVGDSITLRAYDDSFAATVPSGIKEIFGKPTVIQAIGEDFIVILGMIDKTSTEHSDFIIERLVPVMDYVCESGNRLWGCRYGLSQNGEFVNEIYASKLGDFRNWNCLGVLSTDSYVASVGSDGPFTGAISYAGYPTFFKENCMHRVFGNYPANFQIATTNCRGVKKGCSKSLAIVNEVLYYKSPKGICAYDGSLPREISYRLGDVEYSYAVACAFGNKYYISMHDDSVSSFNWIDNVKTGDVLLVAQLYSAEQSNTILNLDGWKFPSFSNYLKISQVYESVENANVLSIDCNESKEHTQWVLFVYDSARDLWHKEDETRVDDFCSYNGELYYIDHYDHKIKTINGSGIQDKTSVEWMAETGIIGTDMPDKKYVSCLNVRLLLEIGSRIHFYAQYDSTGEWEHLFHLEGTSLKSFSIPIRPRRCDHFRLKICGIGEAKIFSITKTIEQGSDI